MSGCGGLLLSLLHASLHLLHRLLHALLDLLLDFAHDFLEFGRFNQVVLVDGNDDIGILNSTLPVVSVYGLDFGHLFDHRYTILRQLTKLCGDQSPRDLLDFAQLEVPNVRQSSLLVQRLIVLIHHSESLG